MAQFLSPEYLAAATAALNGNPAFVESIRDVDLSVQFNVSDTPSGEDSAYTLAIGSGAAELVPGVDEGADVTVANDYATAVGISKGEINTQVAFMQGKLKVGGNMAALLIHQNVIGELANTLSAIEVEY